MKSDDRRLWGQQYPFERNHLQRVMTMAALVGILAFAVVILVHANVFGVLGIAMICAGALAALAALWRHRYTQEAGRGFAILRERGGGFVLGSALLLFVAGALLALVVLLEPVNR
jgi:hypothetical protein